MAGKKLTKYVHVSGEVYAPGDTPPKEVADQITNPDAWAEDEVEAAEPDADTKKK